MLTTYRDERTDLTIEWNGSATFNIQSDDVDIDCFTHYGSAHNDACTPQEAHDAALAHFDELTNPITR